MLELELINYFGNNYNNFGKINLWLSHQLIFLVLPVHKTTISLLILRIVNLNFKSLFIFPR